MTKREYYQRHESSRGYWAKVTVEWGWPEGQGMHPDRSAAAEDVADKAVAAAGPMAKDIVEALQGR